MANIVIATPVLSDAATLSAVGSVAPSLPLDNLQTMRPSEVCRWEDNDGVGVVIDLGASYAISVVALLSLNGTVACQRRVRLAATQDNLTSAPLYDTGLDTLDDPTRFVEVFTAVTCRWVRIDLSDPENSDGFLEASRLYVAAGWQPAVNHSYGWGLGVEDDSEVTRALDGGQLVTRRGKRRVLRASLRFQSEDELYDNAYGLITERGIGKDLLVVRDPDGTTHRLRQTVYGLLAETAPIVNSALDIFDWDFTVRELI